MAIMIDPVTGQGTQMGGVVNPGGGMPGMGYKGGDLSFGAPEQGPMPGGSGIPPYAQIGLPVEPTSAPGGSTPGAGGKGSDPFMDFANQLPNLTDQIVAQQPSLGMPGGSAPGMGGKGGPGGSTPGAGGKGSDPFTGVINQIPKMLDQIVAQQPSLAMPGGLQNLPQPPQAPPAAVAQGGTPGRPVPSAPMSPRGPGYANPGASGVARSLQGAQQQQQQMYAPQGPQNMTQAIQQQAQAVGLNRGPVARPGVPAPINRPLTGNFQPTMPQRRGAGRGGMLR